MAAARCPPAVDHSTGRARRAKPPSIAVMIAYAWLRGTTSKVPRPRDSGRNDQDRRFVAFTRRGLGETRDGEVSDPLVGGAAGSDCGL